MCSCVCVCVSVCDSHDMCNLLQLPYCIQKLQSQSDKNFANLKKK